MGATSSRRLSDGALTGPVVVDQQGTGPAPLTVLQATFTWTQILLNFGIFLSPFLFRQNGLAAFGMIFAAVAVCLSTAVLLTDVLQDTVDSGVQRPGYGDLAEMALGKKFSRFMMFIGPFESFTYCVGNVVVIANTFSVAFPMISKISLIVVSCSLGTLQCSIPDNIYAYFLLGGSISMTAVCVLVVASGMVLPEWAEKWTLLENDGAFLPSAMTSCMFAMAAHCCVPMIFNAVGGDKDKCRKALSVGWIAYFSLSSLFGATCFYIYGSSIQQTATENAGLGLDLQPNEKSSCFLLPMYVFILGRCQIGQVPISRPTADLINKVLGRQQLSGNGGVQGFMSAVPVFFVMGVATYFLLDYLAVFESLAGATIMALNGLIFPGIVYMKLVSKAGCKKVVALCAVGLGIFLFFAVCLKQLT